jgi:hypothetical protein
LAGVSSQGFPDSRRDLLVQGFKGLHPIGALLDGQAATAPEAPGVFVVCRLAEVPPRFAQANTAGRWKGQDPTLPVELLKDAWLPEAALLFVGGGANIRQRLRLFLDFGGGKAVAHWTGRALWQLSDAEDLIVGWRLGNPKADLAGLVADFSAKHGTPPWANGLD